MVFVRPGLRVTIAASSWNVIENAALHLVWLAFAGLFLFRASPRL
jgi:hypothetical protein